MSRSTYKTQNRAKSPVKYYLNFNGTTGKLNYWNGTEKVELDNLSFVVLDIRSSITGWSDAHSARIYSNFVRSAKEELTVRVKTEEIAKGLYNDIKETVHAAGGNFTANIYGLAKIEGEDVLVLLSLSKGNLSAWMNFNETLKKNELYEKFILIKPGDQQKKGGVKFYAASFSAVEPKDTEKEEFEVATEIDSTILQPYFRGDVVEEPVHEEDAPF